MPGGREIVGRSRGLRQALDRVERLAVSDLPVLIQGETGTGKELVARRLHGRSGRRRQPFLPVNCAALSPTLLLSDLFGHVRGAFTGADRDRVGVFEAARGGTVFLDEIGDLPGEAQGKLLRVLQEGEVRRLGESRARAVAARVLAATHRDLETMVAAGSFRRDLYYRLNVGVVGLPPLRERGDDVLLLAEHFLGRLAVETRGAAAPTRLTDRARERLRSHDWPGNVRELENVLSLAVALSDERSIDVEHLELPEETSVGPSDYHRRVEDFRRGLVREALAASDGNRAEAARRLGLSRQAVSYLARRLL
jgi:transcriptional regulator with GAF, ATPase, and Fis domain